MPGHHHPEPSAVSGVVDPTNVGDAIDVDRGALELKGADVEELVSVERGRGHAALAGRVSDVRRDRLDDVVRADGDDGVRRLAEGARLAGGAQGRRLGLVESFPGAKGRRGGRGARW